MIIFGGGLLELFNFFSRYDEEYFQRHYIMIRNNTGRKVSAALQNIPFNKSFSPLSTYILLKVNNCDRGEIWFNFFYIYMYSPILIQPHISSSIPETRQNEQDNFILKIRITFPVHHFFAASSHLLQVTGFLTCFHGEAVQDRMLD